VTESSWPCRGCGARVEQRLPSCHRCGTRRIPETVLDEAAGVVPPPRRARTSRALGALAVVLPLLCGVLGGFLVYELLPPVRGTVDGLVWGILR
jgi:hypothetical protein